MKTHLNRRDFLVTSLKTGITTCSFLACPALISWSAPVPGNNEIPDPKKLNYCGYVCKDDCKMLKATVENDPVLKKQAYTDWKLEEKYGVAFDPEKVICYGCKAQSEKTGIVIEKCSVRKCVISRELECCIECDELASCDEELWKAFPDFKKYVIGLQKNYLESL
jgi:hypothetical protein